MYNKKTIYVKICITPKSTLNQYQLGLWPLALGLKLESRVESDMRCDTDFAMYSSILLLINKSYNGTKPTVIVT